MLLRVEPDDWEHAAAVAELARGAASRHGLTDRLHELALVLDDLAPDERPWWRLAAPGVLEIYGHPGHFLAERGAELAGSLPSLPWDLREPPAPADPPPFAPARGERFLHHHFLAVADVLAGRIVPSAVPAGLAEAFQEAWDVTIDGRLRRGFLPGLPVAERRRRFARLFGAAGVLLPLHWELFHELWDWDDPDQEGLVGRAGRLPPLDHRPPLDRRGA
ncbi:MAG: hypothetical protein C0395_01040 [Gemmatimonas sp.]|nr:hypothetical protein [Gemmatimonas sp.]